MITDHLLFLGPLGKVNSAPEALLQRLQNTKPSIDSRTWDDEEVDRQAGDGRGAEDRIGDPATRPGALPLSKTHPNGGEEKTQKRARARHRCLLLGSVGVVVQT